MRDQTSPIEEFAEPQKARRARRLFRSQQGGSTDFTGFTLTVTWDGSRSELVRLLGYAGMGGVFRLTEVVSEDCARDGCRLWNARFSVTPEVGTRAEAHLPRFLESLTACVPWDNVRKQFVARPEARASIAGPSRAVTRRDGLSMMGEPA